MTRWTLAGCMALAALGAVALLDVGCSTAVAAPDVSPFAGSWSGTWSVAEYGADGTFDWTISDAGRITGTVNSTNGGGGAIAGHVGADGNFMMIAGVPNNVPADGHSGLPFQGTAVIDGDGHLVVSATRRSSTGGSLVAVLERN